MKTDENNLDGFLKEIIQESGLSSPSVGFTKSVMEGAKAIHMMKPSGKVEVNRMLILIASLYPVALLTVLFLVWKSTLMDVVGGFLMQKITDVFNLSFSSYHLPVGLMCACLLYFVVIRGVLITYFIKSKLIPKVVYNTLV